MGCCGGKPIKNMGTQMCCNGALQRRPNSRTKCCDKVAYDTDSNLCCGGTDVVRTIYHCCNGKMMDPDWQTCCDGVVQDRIANGECCGKSIYDESCQLCCGGKRVTDLEHCCDGVPFGKKQMCWGGKVARGG